MLMICCIYMIECVVTGEKYVGSSLDVDRRWSTHRSQLKRQIHHSNILQERWNQYGAAGLRFSILEIVDNPGDLIAREREHVRSGNFICNALYPMKNPMKGRRHSPDSIALMRKNRAGIPGPRKKGEKMPKWVGEKISLAKKGRPISPRRNGYSPEEIAAATARIRAVGSLHFLGRKHTPEARAKMREAAANRSPDHYQRGASHRCYGKPAWNRGLPNAKRGESSCARRVEIDGAIYPSVIDATKALGICPGTFHKRRRLGLLTVNYLKKESS